jgi:hypothetical protein
MALVDRKARAALATVLGALVVFSATGAGKKPTVPEGPPGEPVLWRDPVDIAERDLYYGPGGKAHEPHGTFKFLQEDMEGSSPKFEIVSDDGTKWKAKLGQEARPETAASRLVWAVGYFANEDYFVPSLHVEDLPKLTRGGKDIKPGGMVRNVRLKRHVKGEEKVGQWSWRDCPFTETREWYGLRVLMAVLNNWDLKDINNSIYRVHGQRVEDRYLVSDLGASFGGTGLTRTAKGNLSAYQNSKWMNGQSGAFVDFNVPSGASVRYFWWMAEMVRRGELTWLGRHIPVADVRWMGSLLGRLSPRQIRDAFRAGGYSPTEVEAFSQEIEHRISVLKSL